MILDSRDIARDSALAADLCIIGAGAAGISLALELAGGPHEILVLEGGGPAYDQRSQELYDGPEAGLLIPPGSRYLASTRLRYFGGTTNHWNGFCRPLDREDFEPREWVARSGWPISLADLEPFYARACELLQISPFDYDQATAGAHRRLLDGDEVFETNFFHISPPTRFAQAYRRPLEESAKIRVVTNANVRRIEVDSDARHAVGLDVVRPDGSPLAVTARHYVLATGGIENARVLLNSDRVRENGLGNDYDLVGRCFMEHLAQRIGVVVIPNGRRQVPKTYSKSRVRSRNNWICGAIRPRAEAQRERRLLNSLLMVTPLAQSEVADLAPAVERLARDLRELAALPPIDTRPGYFGWLHAYGEQQPDLDSRVSLSDERDRLGARRSALDWRVDEVESRSMRTTARLFIERLGMNLDARGWLLPPDRPWGAARWSNHHMGTTRMSADPASGVVDPECRLHGVDNVFVAGSSVFATSGSSNPTLTLVALAVRLGHHLKGVLAS
ncbi:MAG: GMC family oxidoreductase [Acidobacteriota bacterium]|nr:GMC family oxidoreductase [Acidobacteriota bacterium]MDH3524497.1 GMC family oxidoreductase [Acidobacteriota bacterium]